MYSRQLTFFFILIVLITPSWAQEAAEKHSKHRADFHFHQFDSTADFRFAQFNSTANFSSAQFNSTANFRSARFKAKVNFSNTIPPKYLDFRHIKDIREEIDFTYARLDTNKEDKCNIALVGTDPGKLKLDYKLFKLWFPEPDTSYQQIVSVYEKLLKKFQDDGFLESYQALDIEYRDWKYGYKGDHIINWVQKVWWNYGYNKGRIFIWIAGFLIFFITINLFLFRYLQKNIYLIDFVEHFAFSNAPAVALSLRYLKFVREVFHIHLANTAIYTLFIFFGLKLDMEKFNKKAIKARWKNQLLLFYVLSIYATGLLCTGYLVNFVLVK